MTNYHEFNIYLNRFLGDFIPILPFLGLLFSNNDLSLSQISVVFFSLATTIFILEVPTGIVADKISVKTVLVTSRFFKLLAFIIFFIFSNFAGAICGMVLWGTASAFDSGAFQSYIFKYSKSVHNAPSFEKVYARSITAALIGLLASLVIATQIENLQYEFLQIIGITSLTLSLLTVLLFKNVKSGPTSSTQIIACKESFTLSIYNTLSQSPLLLPLLLVGILAGGVKGTLDDYTSLLFVDKNLSLIAIGYILLSYEIVRSLGALISQWFKINSRFQTIFLALFGFCFIVAGIGEQRLAITALFLIITLDSILWIHNDIAIQELARDNNRATLASFKNFGTEIVAALVMVFIFLTGGFLTLSKIYITLGIFLVLASIVITAYLGKLKRR